MAITTQPISKQMKCVVHVKEVVKDLRVIAIKNNAPETTVTIKNQQHVSTLTKTISETSLLTHTVISVKNIMSIQLGVEVMTQKILSPVVCAASVEVDQHKMRALTMVTLNKTKREKEALVSTLTSTQMALRY